MECSVQFGISSGGDPILLSALIGFLLSIALNGINLTSILIAAASVAVYEVFKPSWREFLNISLSILISIPFAILKGFILPFLNHEKWEIKPNEGGIAETLAITLTPDSLVVMSDETEHHIHKMVRK